MKRSIIERRFGQSFERLLVPEPVGPVDLDPEILGDRGERLREYLSEHVIGQTEASGALVGAYQMFLSGISPVSHPGGVLLFLGPTGTGKTHSVEMAARGILGTSSGIIRVDCAEYTNEHHLARILGSPPGYLGHGSTSHLITQAKLQSQWTPENHLSFVLFDEIEKACPEFWDMLLGILDRGTLTLGNLEKVDFSKTIIVLTSNVGSRELGKIGKGTGFTGGLVDPKSFGAIGSDAAKRIFSPEFMNRIDKIVTFRKLEKDDLRRILDREIMELQARVLLSSVPFVLLVGKEVKESILLAGASDEYGARFLKRELRKRLIDPVANLISSGQLFPGAELSVREEEGRMRWARI